MVALGTSLPSPPPPPPQSIRMCEKQSCVFAEECVSAVIVSHRCAYSVDVCWLFDEPPFRGTVFHEVPASPQTPCEISHHPRTGSSRGQAAACESRIRPSGRADCGSAGSLHPRTRSRWCSPKSLRELCAHHGCAQCDTHPTSTWPGSFGACSMQLFCHVVIKDTENTVLNGSDFRALLL